MTVFVTADVPAYETADMPIEPLWRTAVGDEDLVYVIAPASRSPAPALVDALPGRKRLVTLPLEIEGGFLLSPLPLHPGQLAPGQINLHGRPLRPLADDPRRLCVSLDLTGFQPVLLDEARRLALRSGMPAILPADALDEAYRQAAE